MPKLIATDLTRDEFLQMKEMTVKNKVHPVVADDSDSSIPVVLEWKDLSLHAQTPAGPKSILRGLTGHASPGELVAIMGPSGAGKTSLLNCLAQRSPGYGGVVLLNGVPWREQFFSILAYMPQDEMFLAQLTPREHLTFMSQLRLHESSESVQLGRVEQVIAEMKLGGVADSLIGDPQSENGLSRNERKRLNFATETLTKPSLLYVDEPTTGLDSVMAASVVKQLKVMAAGTPEQPRRRTVLATIHQPSSEIFNLFDKLYFIVDGRPAFFGRTRDVSAYFSKLGHSMTLGANPADFTMELFVDPANRNAAAARRKELCDLYTTDQVVSERSKESDSQLAKVSAVRAANSTRQFVVLMKRDLVMRSRTPILTKAIIMRNFVLGLLLGLVLLRLKMSQTYVYTITGSIFFGVASQIMPTSIGHISTIPLQLPCVVREIRSNGYHPAPYYLVKFLSDIPVDILGSVIFSVLLSFMSGMSHDSGEVWLKFTAIFFAACFVGNALGQWASIMAPATMPFVGLVALLLTVIPQFLFCGVLILLDQIPIWWSWMSDVSVFRYFLELILQAQWKDYGSIPCDVFYVNGHAVEVCPFRNGQAVLDFYGMGRPPLTCALIIIAWWFFFKLLGYRALLKKCSPPTSSFGGPPPDDATAETMPSGDGDNALLMVSPKMGTSPGGGGDIESGGPVLRRALQPMALSWRDLGLSVKVPDPDGKKKPEPKTILTGLAGNVAPGELVAVMGGSGSGKSVLLRSLGRRQSEGIVSGTVCYNGEAWSPSMKRHVAFMGQEDHFLAEITVHEHLLFHASLRMHKDISEERRKERVEEVMSALGLIKVKNTLIGVIGGGISGGERRRLSYASEILQEPSLLFLDEVTSGLDSSMAEMVIKTLRVAANAGTTILCTIHQPSARVFQLFDKLVLLSRGETAYFGAAKEALPFFESLGYPCPAGGDAVEHIMAIVDATPSEPGGGGGGGGGSVVAFSHGRDAAVTATRKTMALLPPPVVATAVVASDSTAVKVARGVDEGESTFDSSRIDQLRALLKREMLVRKRSKILTKAVIGRTVVISLLLSTVYLQVDQNQKGVFSITGALSFIIINHIFTYVIGQAVTMPLVLPALLRESQANMYGVDVWYLSKTLSDLPFDMITTFILATVTYWAVGFTNDPANYAYFLFMLVLCSLLATGFGHFMGTIATVAGKPEMAVPFVMLLLFPMFLFAGLLVNFNNCPNYLLWLQYISIFYYCFCLVSVNQWKGYGEIKCSAEEAAATQTGQCAFTSGESVLAYFGIKPNDEASYILIVVAMILFFRIGCGLLIKYKLALRQ